jgi:hypothetical protein
MKFIIYLLILIILLLLINTKKENFINYSFYKKNYNKSSLSKNIKNVFNVIKKDIVLKKWKQMIQYVNLV